MDLAKLQSEVGVWARKNFPATTASDVLLGIAEETGELCHAQLKQNQRIRSGAEGTSNVEKMDAVGDLVIYLADYCERSGISLDACVRDAWATVSLRDWIKYPVDGKTR